jgi:hypothetical protein
MWRSQYILDTTKPYYRLLTGQGPCISCHLYAAGSKGAHKSSKQKSEIPTNDY